MCSARIVFTHVSRETTCWTIVIEAIRLRVSFLPVQYRGCHALGLLQGLTQSGVEVPDKFRSESRPQKRISKTAQVAWKIGLVGRPPPRHLNREASQARRAINFPWFPSLAVTRNQQYPTVCGMCGADAEAVRDVHDRRNTKGS